MAPLSIRALAFDFDYTLADSSAAAVACIGHALRVLGLPGVSAQKACSTIGLSLRETYQALVVGGDAASSEAQRFRDLFLEHAEEVMVEQARLFPEVPAVLENLAGRGLPLAIVSTKDRHMIEGILERAGWAAAFNFVIGGDDVGRSKPNPEGLLLAVERLGGLASAVVYVGDSLVDAEASRRAGCPFIAVASGTTSHEVLASHRPLATLQRIEELPETLDALAGCLP